MRILQMALATLLLVFVPTHLVPTAFAELATRFAVRADDVTIPWLFPPPDGLSDFCTEVPAGVHINPDDSGSDRVKQARVIEASDGTKRVVINDLVKGTARDNDGARYTFVYVNNLTIAFDGSQAHVAMKDTFKLKGGDVNYTVGFNWRWIYEADSLAIVEDDIDIGITPFVFATDDGVSESPNIIGGSWRKLRTQGDPWNCDPL